MRVTYTARWGALVLFETLPQEGFLLVGLRPQSFVPSLHDGDLKFLCRDARIRLVLELVRRGTDTVGLTGVRPITKN